MQPTTHTTHDVNHGGREPKSFRFVPIKLHFTFVLLFAFIVMMGFAGGASSASTAFYIIALFASVLLHELGHVLVASLYGIRTASITMYPIGGISRMERDPKPSEEIWIALAGPVVNLLIGGAIIAFLAMNGWLVPFAQLAKPTEANLWERIAVGNFILAAFNLIPAFPMDGGRVLRSLLARFNSAEDASHKAAVIGQFTAVLLGLYGIATMQILLIVISVFIFLTAQQEDAVAVGRKLLQGVPVKAAMMTHFQTLSHGSSMREAADMMLASAQHDFPVVIGGQVIGVLDRTALLHGMVAEGPDSYVAGSMDRNYVALDPEMELSDVLPLLGKIRSCALVMKGEELLGLLTRENLSEFLTLRRFGWMDKKVDHPAV